MNIISYAIGLNSSGGSKEPVLESISITANGTYTPDAGIDGYNSVSVNVPQDGAPTAEELTFTGKDLGDNAFSGKLADVVCSKYLDKISFNDITKINRFGSHMSNHIDFSSKTINFSLSFYDISDMFLGFSGTVLPNVISEKPLPMQNSITGLMNDMDYVRYLPASFDNLDFSLMNNNTSWFSTFVSGNSLRSISPAFLAKWYNANTSGMTPMKYLNNLPSLDELVNFPLSNKAGVSTSNQFNGIYTLSRVKNFTFETNNGQPYVVSWKNQNMDLSYNGLGYTSSYYKSDILNYNSGITADKEVKDAATYEALKNDADWFTTDINYSRYNHDSAVATINSLPDTSAYLAANGGTNTIKFKGESGKLTDGGAINTLTEEEIAVAVAKGWGVAFV